MSREEGAARDRPSLFWSKAWYFTSFSTSAMLQPLLNLYFKRSGLSDVQIGVITAMKPWTSAVAGNLWASLGDHTGAYKTILLMAHVSAVTLRYCIGLAGTFPLILTFVVTAEAMTAPLQILADASAMAVGQEGDYGKARLWGAVGWGAFSPVAGLIVARFGEKASFNSNLIGGILVLLPTLLLPTDALKQRQAEKLRLARKLEDQENGLDISQADSQTEDCKGDHRLAFTRRSGDFRPSSNEQASTSNSSQNSSSHAYPENNWQEGQAHKIQEALDGDDELSDFRHQAGKMQYHPHNGHKGMKRGDSYLFEVVDDLPLAPAPDFVEYESIVIHQHTSRRRLSVEAQHSSAEEPTVSPKSEDVPSDDGLHDLTVWQKVKLLLSDLELIVFLLMAVLFGFATGAIDGYLFIYLDSLGGPEVLMGLTITLSCCLELPIFHYMGSILQFVGVQAMLHWVMLFFLIRLFCYSMLGYLPSPWLVLPVETLNAITFGCAWAAGTVQCSRSAPAGLEATTQSIYAGLYGGLGRGLGGLFGGLVYGKLGPRSTFLATAVVMCVGWAICAAAQQLIRCSQSKRDEAEFEPLLES